MLGFASDMRRALTEGGASLEGCTAGLDGGAIYSSAGIAFGLPNPLLSSGVSTNVLSNVAMGNGGGIMAYGCLAQLSIAVGHTLRVNGNYAAQDGGGIGFDQGASIRVEGASCSSAGCSVGMIGDGKCDGVCMFRECNWYLLSLDVNRSIQLLCWITFEIANVQGWRRLFRSLSQRRNRRFS